MQLFKLQLVFLFFHGGLRVQESMPRLDPPGIVRTLQLQTVRRRRYSVPAPNSQRHIYGNHKLIN